MKGWRPTTEAAARERIPHLGEAPWEEGWESVLFPMYGVATAG